MNEFTKEELEDIKYLIDDYESHYGEFGRLGLGDKVRGMIDNYCEHEWELQNYGSKCRKCNEVKD